jgi:hypothetical protein
LLFRFVSSNDYLAERPSPSSPQEQAEPRLEAGEGLDVTACSASSLDRWDADRESLFKLMYKFASPENREMANSDPDIANMAHDFAEIVTHRSDLRYGTMSNSVSVFGEAKIES